MRIWEGCLARAPRGLAPPRFEVDVSMRRMRSAETRLSVRGIPIRRPSPTPLALAVAYWRIAAVGSACGRACCIFVADAPELAALRGSRHRAGSRRAMARGARACCAFSLFFTGRGSQRCLCARPASPCPRPLRPAPCRGGPGWQRVAHQRRRGRRRGQDAGAGARHDAPERRVPERRSGCRRHAPAAPAPGRRHAPALARAPTAPAVSAGDCASAHSHLTDKP